MEHQKNYNWEISSAHALFDLKLKATWEYRDLMWLLVRRDFVSTYKQTILGPLWFIVQPILTTVIYTLVFGNIAHISTSGLPGPLFYMAGITAWNYFADCFLKTTNVFRDNAAVFGKVYFPRLVVPISNITSSVVRFGIQLLLFFCFLAYYGWGNEHVHPNLVALLLPLLVLLMAGMGLGAGMIISALTTKYRDLSFLVSFGMQLLMYATTVIYPLSAAPAKYKWIIVANPMTPIIETFRYGFLGAGSFTWETLSYSAIVTAILVIIGSVVFTKTERNFIDTV